MMRATWTFAAASVLVASSSYASPRVVILDDGERIARDENKPLAKSMWPDPAEITLFALHDETIAIQVVIEAGDVAANHVHATIAPFMSNDRNMGRSIDVKVETFAEQFVDVVKPTRNVNGSDSLAFTESSAPLRDAFTGFLADALVPSIDVDAKPRERAAIWIDLTVPHDAPAGTYASAVLLGDDQGAITSRALSLRVIAKDLPYAAAKTMIYYDPHNLERRMGDKRAERELRFLLHNHHISAIHDVKSDRDLAFDEAALRGDAFTAAGGYDGAGVGIGEGVFAIGAYGSLGALSRSALSIVEKIATSLRASDPHAIENADVFVYAIDETCDSAWPGEWMTLIARSEAARGVRVGATCGEDPIAQKPNIVMMTAPDLFPSRAALAKDHGKDVWAYNGQRPYAGPMMIDVPATDLRANAWIAERYGIDRWFYWESTYWFDDINGGHGGEHGFDPFTTAETFHNKDGDAANLDGVLVYPGTQRTLKMRDFGEATVFPSVRLKNLRRGIEDAGYIALARAIDRDRTDAIVRRMIPRALAYAGDRVAWPESGAAWTRAREELAAIISPIAEKSETKAAPSSHVKTPAHLGCGANDRGRSSPRDTYLACAVLLSLAWLARRAQGVRP
jgi:hypothetical protein